MRTDSQFMCLLPRASCWIALTCLFAASCASMSPERPAPPPTKVKQEAAEAANTAPQPKTGAEVQAVPAAHNGASSTQPVPAAAKRPGDPGFSGEDLALWRDPAFQRWFAESYAAESEIEPRLTQLEREAMEEVIELMAADRIDDAIELLEDERDEDSNAVYDYTVANLYFQQERIEEATVAFQIAVAKHPRYRRAWRHLGFCLLRQDELAMALEALSKVVELGGGDSVTYGLLGLANSTLENDLAAESAYRMALLLAPGTVEFEMGLARSLFRQQRFGEASNLCGALITKDPNDPKLWMLQANAFIGLKQPLRAAENLELVDSLGASTADSLNLLGDVYVNEELYDLAVDAYARALAADDKGRPELPLRAAQVLARRGALDGSLVLVERIDEVFGDGLNPNQKKEVLRLRARIAVSQGAGDEEARILEEIVALDPLDGEALILLGQHRRTQGKPEEAIFLFERAANLEDFEAEAKVAQAQVLVVEGRYAAALPLLRRAQTLEPRENIQKFLEDVERIAKSR